MYKVIAIAFIASLPHLPIATAKENTSPPVDDGPQRVSCKCTCTGGGLTSSKSWSWSGSRGGCRSYSGGACRIVINKKNGGTTERDGTLSNCDVIVIKTKRNTPVNQKPDGALSR